MAALCLLTTAEKMPVHSSSVQICFASVMPKVSSRMKLESHLAAAPAFPRSSEMGLQYFASTLAHSSVFSGTPSTMFLRGQAQGGPSTWATAGAGAWAEGAQTRRRRQRKRENEGGER
eukprot:1991200-Pyramimonas_sp.AAC.1